MTQELDRLLRRDSTLWPDGNVSQSRLGWLDLPSTTSEEIERIIQFADSVDQSHVVLCGMGGSSLGAMMLVGETNSKGAPNGRRFTFVDTTHPSFLAAIDISDTAFVMASKSGTTVEVDSAFEFFWSRVKSPERFVILSDPGSPLIERAEARGIRRVMNTPVDVGGRYSVLTPFGSVAFALAGGNLHALFDGASSADLEASAASAASIASAIAEGSDLLGLRSSPEDRVIALWMEQLVAESLGKIGKAFIPVVNDLAYSGRSMQTVPVAAANPFDLGRLIIDWETKTALIGHHMGVDPFSEPDVAAAKAATRKILASDDRTDRPKMELPDAVNAAADILEEGDYLAILAFIDPSHESALLRFSEQLAERFPDNPVTVGLGPRFLHSTGQMHKGGPNRIVALSLSDNYEREHVGIPGASYDYTRLIGAQALGDFETLKERGRRVVRAYVDPETGL